MYPFGYPWFYTNTMPSFEENWNSMSKNFSDNWNRMATSFYLNSLSMNEMMNPSGEKYVG